MSNEIIMDDYDDKDIEINKIKSTNEKILNDKLKDNSNKTELKNNVIIKKTFLSSKEKLNAIKKLLQKKPFIKEKKIIKNNTQKSIKQLINKTSSNTNNNNILINKKEINNINNISLKIGNNNNKNKILNQKRNRDEKLKKEEKEKKTEEEKKKIIEIINISDSENKKKNSSSLSFSSSSENEKPKKIEIKQNTTNKNQKPKTKSILVYQLLKRWWYVLPKWPPDNYDCSNKLKKNKLRIVKLIDWKKEPKYDINNNEKCIELPGFKYVFCNSNGDIFDFRPDEYKPSFNSLMKLPENKLYKLISDAIKKQIEILKNENGYYNKKLIEELNDELKKNEIIYNIIRNK